MATSTSSKELHEAKQSIRAPRIPAMLRAVLLLALVAAGGWLLARLGRLDPPPAPIREFADRLGNRLFLLDVAGPRAPGQRSRPARAVMSRVPIRVQPRRSLLVFADDGSRRILPPGAPAVLVYADRRIEALASPLPPHLVFELQTQPPGADSLPRWFQHPRVERALAGADPRLRGFWAR